ncbi:hypothetical protein HDF15_002536 [Granulicella mallensis]|uniref:Uncharacterized protein n=1 Tax=Granulicella mallensis TaxID=940614 RepID=A0A7W7ZQC5_9BACT|nr:hypothetical protein [Granulicella mallensis]
MICACSWLPSMAFIKVDVRFRGSDLRLLAPVKHDGWLSVFVHGTQRGADRVADQGLPSPAQLICTVAVARRPDSYYWAIPPEDSYHLSQRQFEEMKRYISDEIERIGFLSPPEREVLLEPRVGPVRLALETARVLGNSIGRWAESRQEEVPTFHDFPQRQHLLRQTSR